MTSAQEKLGRALAAAMRALTFNARVTGAAQLDADVASTGVGGARVEVRHPFAQAHGMPMLVAIVSLETRPPRVTYALEMYRDAVERTVAKVNPGGAK